MSRISYKQFLSHCQLIMSELDHRSEADLQVSAGYLSDHAWRFYRTYEVCVGLLPRRGRLLSVGPGRAFVEAVLVRELGAEVLAVDLPEAIELMRRFYDDNGFTSLGADLSRNELDLPFEDCDMVLSSEVIEHLPAPPSFHIQKLAKCLRPGGYLVITTPNLGSLLNIEWLLRMRPILPPPERTFGPVNFENEGIHRREYAPREIIEPMAELGLEHVETHFIEFGEPRVTGVRSAVRRVVPRFRQGMIIVGRKLDDETPV